MSTKPFVSRVFGFREEASKPQQRETIPVAKAAEPVASEQTPRECINCNQTPYLDTTKCTNCGWQLRQEMVDQDLYAAAMELMEKPDCSAIEKKAGATSVLLAYDDHCRRHYDPKQLGVYLGRNHPERPERVAAIMAKLQESGLLGRCQRYKGREATKEELLAVHDKALLAAIEKATEVAVLAAQRDKTTWYGPLDAQLEAMRGRRSEHIQDVYFNAATAAAALVAAGSAAEVARRVVSGVTRHGAAIIRPPGHHAESSTAMGFCYYNNAAVAARAAQSAGARRVVIMDWDVHHGNGTQRIFYNDPTVLYMSTHRYDNGCFYPGSGGANETGTGPGTGFTVNVPWNGSGVGDADMLAAFRHVIVPIAAEFRPDLVIVSAGFDAAEGDPLGECSVSTAAFSHFAAMLCALGPTVLLLEGGYNLIATAAATEACLRVLLGEAPMPLAESGLQMAATAAPSADPWVAAGLDGVSDNALASIRSALYEQSKHWEAARQHKAVIDAAMDACFEPQTPPRQLKPAAAAAPAAEPTAAEPTAVESTVAEPTVAEPTAAEPTAAEPTAAEPTAAEPTAAEPTAAQPTAAEPTAAEPTAAEPTAAEPTAAEPTAAEPTATEPTAAEPTAAEPTAAEPTAAEPTAAEPTAAEPLL